MQNLDILQTDSVTTLFDTQLSSFSSTEQNLKQRYMQDFLKDLKKSEAEKQNNLKDVLFEEIKSLLDSF